ncbi:MAG: hypothetical protein IKQ44_08585 [Lachnospiraceae bacterium]|nr:hypothetical protein [Lachnospiraceae bacterium]
MKKFLLLTICVTMITTFASCGNTNELENTSNPVVEENVIEETPSEETVTVEEEAPAEPVEEIVSEKEEEKSSADTGLTEEYAAEKLVRATKAYQELKNNTDKVFETNVQVATVTGNVKPSDAESKDGVALSCDNEEHTQNTYLTYLSMYTKYYDEYINNNGEYFDFVEYYKTHTSSEILDYGSMKAFNDDQDGTYDSNECYLRNMIWFDSLNGELSIKNITDDISVNCKVISMPYNKTTDAAWQCDIYSDGEDTGLKMLFDKDGNLLNLNDENAKIEFVLVFE